MIEVYSEELKPLVGSWWEARGGLPVPDDILPSTGLVCNRAAAGWLYLTNSNVGFVEWLISDPANPDARESVTELIEALETAAKDMGCRFVTNSTGSSRLSTRLKGHGWTALEDNVTVTLKEVG